MTAKKGNQKLYRNAGASELVFEGVAMEPGSEFHATLAPEQEMQLLQGGHIEILQDQTTKADKAQASAAETGVDTNPDRTVKTSGKKQ